ncbi:MAG: hypothetical protein JHC30_07615 [Caldisericum sp.]|nr:hypothetical protein [Caldisericum sp.]
MEKKNEKVNVKVRAEDHHWGWVAKRLPDNPPFYYHTVIGLWGFEYSGREIKFRRPISIRRFNKYCEEIESDNLWNWIYLCDKNYIDKLISSKNVIKL